MVGVWQLVDYFPKRFFVLCFGVVHRSVGFGLFVVVVFVLGIVTRRWGEDKCSNTSAPKCFSCCLWLPPYGHCSWFEDTGGKGVVSWHKTTLQTTSFLHNLQYHTLTLKVSKGDVIPWSGLRYRWLFLICCFLEFTPVRRWRKLSSTNDGWLGLGVAHEPCFGKDKGYSKHNRYLLGRKEIFPLPTTNIAIPA